MENNKNKKSVKFQGDMLNFCDFIQVFVFTRNHHLKHNILGLTLVWGWSGGAKVLSKLSVPGHPTSLYDSRARAYCACSRCRWGGFDIFSLIYIFSSLSPTLWETARYRLKYCLKGPLNPKQPTLTLV